MNDKKYKRVGKCNPNKCGAFCCRVGALLQRSPPPTGTELDTFYKMFGWQKIMLGKTAYYHSNQPCKHLMGNKCAIHKKKPEYPCKVFPQAPDQEWYKIAKKMGCTYRFKQRKN